MGPGKQGNLCTSCSILPQAENCSKKQGLSKIITPLNSTPHPSPDISGGPFTVLQNQNLLAWKAKRSEEGHFLANPGCTARNAVVHVGKSDGPWGLHVGLPGAISLPSLPLLRLAGKSSVGRGWPLDAASRCWAGQGRARAEG